jgi:hypothetical protein
MDFSVLWVVKSILAHVHHHQKKPFILTVNPNLPQHHLHRTTVITNLSSVFIDLIVMYIL